MITIVGNSLNSCNKKILDKMNKMDYEFIKREVNCQLEQGAEYIELNATSLLHNEVPFLKKVIPLVETIGGKVLVRSRQVDTLLQSVQAARKDIVIGDVEFDQKKLDRLIDVLKGDGVKLIALIEEPSSNEEPSPERSLLIAQKYVDYLLDHGISRNDILLDPSVRPLDDHFSNGLKMLNTLELFKMDFPQVRTIANMNTLSEGLPRRYLLTAYFLALAIEKGLDYLVLNVMEESILESIISTMTILGKDKNMQRYLKFCRERKEAKSKGA